MSNSDSAAQVQSVDRAISVLELLAQGEAGITEIAGELGVHKSTAFRLVAALENGEEVMRFAFYEGFILSSKLADMESAWQPLHAQLDHARRAQPADSSS